jgi:C1A family cysteine protease
MDGKKIFRIGASFLIILLIVTSVVNAISINNNLELEEDVEKNDCGCEDKNNELYFNNESYQLGLLPGGDPLPPGKDFTGRAPTSWDWRDKDGKDWTTPIKNQGNCGSCYAFGSYAAMESCIKIKSNEPDLSIDLSEQFMVSCGKEWLDGINGCDGAYFNPIFQFIKTYGAIPESCFPYTSGGGSVPPCSNKCSNWQDLQMFINDWGVVSSTQSSIKNALIEYGPLPTGMKVYYNFYDYSGGVYEPSGSLQGYHLVTIVGYNDNPGYWICKNSWGTNWGESGWFKIKYGVCDIEKDTAYLEVQGQENLFSQTKCGTLTSKRSGDIYNYNSCCVSMSEHVWGGDATAWYEFNIGKVKVKEGMEIGIEFADWGWFGNGPNLYVYNWVDKKYTCLGTNLGDNDEFKWVWKTTTNSQNYVREDGVVEVKVWTEELDWTILYHVGIRGQLLMPNLKCSGDLNFGYIAPGQSATKTIKVHNIGAAGSELDWKISSWPNWGTWTFTPNKGNKLKPEDGAVTITVKVVAPTTQDEYSGKVKIINENDDSDYEFIDASLTTRRSRQYSTTFLVFLQEKIQLLLSRFLFVLKR